MSTDKFQPYIDKLDEFNSTLDSAIILAENSLSLLETIENFAIDKAQEYVDEKCEYISDKLSIKLNEKREDVIDALHKKYESLSDIISILDPIVNAELIDLGSCISVLNNIIKMYVGPYSTVIAEMAGLAGIVIPKVMDSANKINTLISLKDQIPIPENMPINFDKLNITVDPITLPDIVQGPVKPEPEPEPDKGNVIRKLQVSFNSIDELNLYYGDTNNFKYLKKGDVILVNYSYYNPYNSTDEIIMLPMIATSSKGKWNTGKRVYKSPEEIIKIKSYLYWEKGQPFLFKDGGTFALGIYTGIKYNPDTKKYELQYQNAILTASEEPVFYVNVYNSGVDWSGDLSS